MFVWVIKSQPSPRIAFALLRLNSFVRRYAAFARAYAKSQLGQTKTFVGLWTLIFERLGGVFEFRRALIQLLRGSFGASLWI